MMKIFREGMFKGDCDQCGASFDPVSGGVCASCKRILCGRHFYGSLTRRLAALVRPATVCVKCLREGKR